MLQNKRIFKAEQGLFIPLLFLITGGMGRECSMFIKTLGQLLSRKHNERLGVVTYAIRYQLSHALL